QLANVQKVWIVEYAGEVKEVLYQLGTNQVPVAQIPIEVTGINDNGQTLHSFEFTPEAEKEATPAYSDPLGYLYEPSPALLKSGAMKLFGERFSLQKLHENTHLFTSEALIQGVPGRSFEIVSVCRYDKKEIQAAVPGLKASMATRNFPDSPEMMARKLGLRSGGSVYLFGVTLHDQRKAVLICRKPPQHPDLI
ncbi:MAG: THUMP-like domain-containing protein, partial [Bacteroidota bacterium]